MTEFGRVAFATPGAGPTRVTLVWIESTRRCVPGEHRRPEVDGRRLRLTATG